MSRMSRYYMWRQCFLPGRVRPIFGQFEFLLTATFEPRPKKIAYKNRVAQTKYASNKAIQWNGWKRRDLDYVTASLWCFHHFILLTSEKISILFIYLKSFNSIHFNSIQASGTQSSGWGVSSFGGMVDSTVTSVLEQGGVKTPLSSQTIKLPSLSATTGASGISSAQRGAPGLSSDVTMTSMIAKGGLKFPMSASLSGQASLSGSTNTTLFTGIQQVKLFSSTENSFGISLNP